MEIINSRTALGYLYIGVENGVYDSILDSTFPMQLQIIKQRILFNVVFSLNTKQIYRK